MIRLGIPVHFRITSPSGVTTSCGLQGSSLIASYDGRDTECLRCRRTKRWKVYMGVDKPKATPETNP